MELPRDARGGKGSATNVLKYKTEVLLDLLAVARANEKSSAARYEKERIANDQCRKKLKAFLTLSARRGDYHRRTRTKRWDFEAGEPRGQKKREIQGLSSFTAHPSTRRGRRQEKQVSS